MAGDEVRWRGAARLFSFILFLFSLSRKQRGWEQKIPDNGMTLREMGKNLSLPIMKRREGEIENKNNNNNNNKKIFLISSLVLFLLFLLSPSPSFPSPFPSRALKKNFLYPSFPPLFRNRMMKGRPLAPSCSFSQVCQLQQAVMAALVAKKEGLWRWGQEEVLDEAPPRQVG